MLLCKPRKLPTMTLTKSHLIDAISKQKGFTRKKSTETVGTIFEIIKSPLASGDDVLISGFGKFCVNENGSGEGGTRRLGRI